MHGGIGMTWDYVGSHHAKRLVMIDNQVGDRRDHLLRLVSSKRSGAYAEVTCHNRNTAAIA